MKKLIFIAMLFIAACKTETIPTPAYYYDIDDNRIELQKALLINYDKDGKCVILTQDSFKMHLEREQVIF